MRIDYHQTQDGFSLLELLAFMVVIAVGITGMLKIFNQSVVNSVDPILQVRALELAQSQLDEVLARKYDTTTPTGGVPACTACDPFNAADQGNFDDVDDYAGYSDPAPPYPGYTVNVSVQAAGPGAGSGADLPGLSNAGAAKLITVTVGMPDGNSYRLSAYRVNF